jgi:aquaporin Z
MEAAGLGCFMISACGFGTLIEHPSSPIRQAVADPTVRRMMMGAAMGLTAAALVYSPWGMRSGAHLNPSVTLTFLRLGKVRRADALFYALAQFAGATLGVTLMAGLLGAALGHPAVHHVTTAPGPRGPVWAFAAELAISAGLMSVVLLVSNTPRLARATGWFAGTVVATWITLEAPISGMSMNPARTLGSAIGAQSWTSWWIYFTAPPLGMLLASEAYLRLRGRSRVRCAKLVHSDRHRCIFCGFEPAPRSVGRAAGAGSVFTAPAAGEPSAASTH